MSMQCRCDHCGKTVAHRDIAAGQGWLRVASVPAIADYFKPGSIERAVDADLCSWPCVRDYAIVQMLEPARDTP